MTRRVELYGRLRDAGAGDALELELPPHPVASEVLAAVARALGRPEALAGAVLASEEAVLATDAPVPERVRLAVLPPVCGG